MNEHIERLWRRLVALVGGGRVTASNDAGPVQILQIRLREGLVLDDVPRLAEYGLASHPPAGSDVTALHLGGSMTDAVVVATGHQPSRPRSLEVGEVVIYDNRGQRIHLSVAGIVITAPLGLTINGDVTFNGSVTANGHSIDETHTHGGVVTGGGTTGEVT